MFTEPNPKILDDFYECTKLSISAYSSTEEVECTNPNCQGHCLLDSPAAKQCVRRAIYELYNKEHSPYVEMPLEEATAEKVHFAACYINPNNPQNGCYVFGPYTTQKNSSPDLPYLPEIATSHMVDLLYSISKKYGLSPSQLDDIPNYHLRRIVTYMHQHFQEELSLNEIAMNFHLSEAYLCRLFKKETGHTYTEILNRIRIDKSMELLTQTSDPLIEISSAVGFNSQSYYCRQFKKLVGISPSEFRSTNRKKNNPSRILK